MDLSNTGLQLPIVVVVKAFGLRELFLFIIFFFFLLFALFIHFSLVNLELAFPSVFKVFFNVNLLVNVEAVFVNNYVCLRDINYQ